MVDADFLREGAAFVMPVLYGKALCVHLRDFRKVVIVTEKPQDMMLFVEDLMILQKDNKKRTERNTEKVGDKHGQGNTR